MENLFMNKQENPKKEGVSVQELENFGKNYYLEIFFSAVFILASLFSFLFFGPMLSIYALGIGGVIGSCLSKQVARLAITVFNFCLSQQKATKIVIAVVGLVFAIVVPPVVFLISGLMAGKGLCRYAKESCKMHCGHDHSERDH